MSKVKQLFCKREFEHHGSDKFEIAKIERDWMKFEINNNKPLIWFIEIFRIGLVLIYFDLLHNKKKVEQYLNWDKPDEVISLILRYILHLVILCLLIKVYSHKTVEKDSDDEIHLRLGDRCSYYYFLIQIIITVQSLCFKI